MMGFLQKSFSRLLPVLTILMTGAMWGQITLPAESPYSQNFNTTPGATGTTYPQGWMAYRGTNSDNTMSVGTSTSTTGDNYNYGSRIGLLASGNYSAPLAINMHISNTAGRTNFKISYKVIKIREQGRSNSFNLEMSTTSPFTGFTPVTGGTYASGSLAEGNVATYTDIELPASIDNRQPGQPVYLRWYYSDISGSGSRDGIALDDVVLTWVTSPVIPDAPVATTATDITSIGFTANWNPVNNATGYRLDVSADADFTSILEDYDNIAVAGTSKEVTLGLQPSTTYYYRVRAELNAEISDNSNVITTATQAPPLAAPVAVDETAVLSNGFTANWQAVPGATGYYLDVSTSPDFGTLEPGTFITETFENMPAAASAHTTHSWTGDEGIEWTAALNRTDRVISQTTDRLLCLFEASATDDAYLQSGVITGGLTNITFDIWKVLNNGTFASVNVYVLSGDNFETQTTIGTINTPTVTSTKAIFDSEPITGITGDYKIKIEVIASNNARAGVNNLKFGADEILLPVFVTGYENLNVGDVLTYNVTGLTPNTTYYYRVRAFDANRTSVNSNIIDVQTVCETVVPPTVTATEFCGSVTVADFLAAGTGLKLYSADAPTVELAPADALISGDYIATATVNGCESTGTPVTITVNAIPDAPEAAPLTLCGTPTVAELTVTTGTNLKWYADNTIAIELLPTETVIAGNYFVSQTVNGCESARTEVAVTVNTIPDAPEAAPLAFCGNATVAQLTATTGSGLKWYADNTITDVLVETEALVSGNYYVSQTVNGCESERTEVAITLNTVPDAPETAPLTFCGNATVAQLTATTGSGLKWYADNTTTDVLAETEELVSGNYYVSQTVNGCESARTEVVVTLNTVPDAPGVNSTQVFCGAATIADLSPNTAEYKWYVSLTATDVLDADTVISNGLSMYYVSQTVNGCESLERSAVAVMVNVTPEPVATPITFCEDTTVADLDATGTDLKWYADATSTTELADTEELVSGSYYVTQTLNNCESARVEVVVTISEPTVTGDATQIYNEGETLADLVITATGTDVIWYADDQLIQVLPETTVLVHNTTYYVVSVAGICTSDALAITVADAAGVDGFDAASLKYFPNPVKDVLTISYKETITSVMVYNLLGQPVFMAKPNAAEVKTDMSQLAAGSYIVSLESAGKTQTIKVIKH